MRELIGYWEGGYRLGSYEVYIQNGKLSLEKKKPFTWYNNIGFKRDFGNLLFGDKEFLVGTSTEFVHKILLECNGKDKKGIEEIAKKYKDKREANRTSDFRKQKEWEKLRDKFDGIVIGVDSQIDVYESGFSVRVLFSSDVTFGGRKQFLFENKIEFVKWVMREIENSKVMTRRIGDMKFYKPVEIINLRVHEVEVKFEVKNEVA